MAVLISSVQHKQRADAVVIFPQPLSAAELAPHNSAEITSAEFQARDFLPICMVRCLYALILRTNPVKYSEIDLNTINALNRAILQTYS